MVEKVGFCTVWWVNKSFAQSFAREMRRIIRGVLHIKAVVLHEFCTGGFDAELVIDFTPDFFDLVAEGEVKFEVVFDFGDTVHGGTVVLDADLGGDFGGTDAELFLEEIHGDLAGVFDVGDAIFTFELVGGEVVVFGDFVDDTLGGSGLELSGVGDADGAAFDEL